MTRDTHPTASRKPRQWIWYFVVLGLLAVTAIVTLVSFNLRQQLKPEQLEAARLLWKEKQPRDYDLQWTKKSGGSTATFQVWVRHGRVQGVVMKQGDAPEKATAIPLPPRLYADYDMTALFDDIERFLKIDAEPRSPRAFNVASFDSADGHLIHYRRSVMGTGQSVEIGNVKLHPEAPGTPVPDLAHQ